MSEEEMDESTIQICLQDLLEDRELARSGLKLHLAGAGED